MFAFQTLGVMSDAAEAIATDGDVRVHIDMCICIKHTLYIHVRTCIG